MESAQLIAREREARAESGETAEEERTSERGTQVRLRAVLGDACYGRLSLGSPGL